jgi:hypothetical protein
MKILPVSPSVHPYKYSPYADFSNSLDSISVSASVASFTKMTGTLPGPFSA